jgi:L-seryl-tRNA(Ser) seleniumtransferase
LRNVADLEALRASLRGASLAAIVRSPDAEPWLALAEAAALAREAQAAMIDVSPFAGLIDPQVHGLPAIETIRHRLASGADLVVVDGAGLLGGPACGLIVGKRALVEQAARHPWATLAALDPFRAAALDATLRVYREDEAAIPFTIPVWQLLSAPIDNLQQRAERLAALIAAIPGISSAEAQALPSTWLEAGELRFSAPDWTVLVRQSHGSGSSLCEALASGERAIIARPDDEGVRFHVRSAFPRWDQELAAAIARCSA